MRNGTMGLAAAILLASAVGTTGAEGPPGAPPGPRVIGGAVQARPVGERGLAAAVRALAAEDRPAWIGWTTPLIEGRHRLCCFESLDRVGKDPDCCSTCRLEREGSSGSFSMDDGRAVRLEDPGWLVVLARVERGRVVKIRSFSEDCRLDAGGLAFIRLDGVRAVESLDFLAGFLPAGDDRGRDDGDEDLFEQAIAAIAMHADARADRLLEGLTTRSRPFTVRDRAAFWLGVARGRTGYEFLRKLVADESDAEYRKKLVFALSQSAPEEATDTLIGLARNDRDPEVRGEAVFWLAQKAGDRAARTITDAIENDPDTEVKRRAVFALTQLPHDEGVPLLIDLARRHRNPAVRKEAIFWLGQSGDPRALDFIEQVLKG